MTKKIAFLFPGQGTQTVGMLNAFSENNSFVELCASLSELADFALGEPLTKLIAQGPADSLNLTVNTQPAMLFADVLCYQAWLKSGGGTPSFVAGHSLGEYAALVAAGGISLEAAIRLVRFRANAMQNAVPVGQGGMAAIIGLDADQVKSLCKKVTQQVALVEPVNFNAPNQIVVAGKSEAIEIICTLAKENGAKRALPLPVSAPFHSSLLKPAADKLYQYLTQLKLTDLKIPLVTNVDVLPQTKVLAIKDSLVRQAYNPVRWVETIEYFANQNVELFVECGPGKVLAGLVKRITDIPVANISSPESINSVLELIE